MPTFGEAATINLCVLPCCLCFHSTMSLREISENVKLAREYALLGNYSSASVLYHGLLEQIKKYVYTVRDSSFQQRWQQVNMAFKPHQIKLNRQYESWIF